MASPRRVNQCPRFRAPRPHRRNLDDFFRHMVANMRNGVLAINRAGEVVLINDEAYRIFRLPPDLDYLGQPYAEVFRSHPDIVRVLSGAFEMAALPNRAELRLKTTGKVIGYTLSLIRNEHDETVGAALFFKDLTHVEQMEERERLRDRLAALGEMAAAMAHEIKNPLGGIEVMAGLLRRQVPDNRDAQALVADIINEAKMANAIVQEMLDFVRPGAPATRSRVGRGCAAERCDDGRRQGHARRARRSPSRLEDHCRSSRATPPAGAGVCQPADQRLRSAQRPRRGHADGAARRWNRADGALLPDGNQPVRDRGRGSRGHGARASRPRCSTRSSTRSLRPSRRGRASAWPSCARSSTPTKAEST